MAQARQQLPVTRTSRQRPERFGQTPLLTGQVGGPRITEWQRDALRQSLEAVAQRASREESILLSQPSYAPELVEGLADLTSVSMSNLTMLSDDPPYSVDATEEFLFVFDDVVEMLLSSDDPRLQQTTVELLSPSILGDIIDVLGQLIPRERPQARSLLNRLEQLERQTNVPSRRVPPQPQSPPPSIV